jgi:hypothetical protein
MKQFNALATIMISQALEVFEYISFGIGRMETSDVRPQKYAAGRKFDECQEVNTLI